MFQLFERSPAKPEMLHVLAAAQSRRGRNTGVGKRSRVKLLATCIAAVASTPAAAQLVPPAPVRPSVDSNGVDLFNGTYVMTTGTLTIGQGDPQGLSYSKFNAGGGWSDSVIAALNSDGTGTVITVSLGGYSDSFSLANGVYTNSEGNGSTLTLSSNLYTYTRADGTIIHFDKTKATPSPYYSNEGRATNIIYPSGTVLTFTYDSIQYCSTWKALANGDVCEVMATAYRPATATSNYGYKLSFSYPAYDYFYDSTDPSAQPDFATWSNIVGVSATNLANPSAPARSVSFSTINVSGVTHLQATDPLGRMTDIRYTGPSVQGITLPGSSAEDLTVNYVGGGNVGRISSIVTPAGTTNYVSSDVSGVRTVTVTDPMNHATTYTFDIASARMTSVKDAANQTTAMQYDANGRMTRVTKPEGNYTQATYDPRGNVTQLLSVAKSGSGLSNIALTAGYDATCANPVTCNKPNWVKDAKGNETDFTYDATHGGILTVTRPAPSTGAVRPQTRYGYTSLQAYYQNSSGSIAASGQPVWKLTSISQCQTLASCAGAADEVKTTISYGPQTAGVGNNLLPVSASSGDGAGTLTATTAYTWDAVGNLTYVDGPLLGAGDTVRALYNADRESIGTILADPDGSGSLPNRAVRNTIDSKGLLTRVEYGTTAGQADTAWNAFAPAQTLDITYDTRRRVATKKLSAGGTAYALTQASYNADDSVDCVATRMNTSVYGSLPANACTLSTQGSFGADRIAEASYDSDGRVTQVQVGIGTGFASYERTLTYSNNGLVQSLTDANNNKTTFVYDGLDRLSQTQYPNPTKGAGTSNAADYEQLTYDANGNVTQFRARNGVVVGYGHDFLNRMVTRGSSTTADLKYGYDLLDRPTTATFATGGQGITNNFDALGRLATSTSDVDGTARTMSYAYDLAGNRTRLTWSDGYYVNYDRLVTGEVQKIRENGATSGVGVLATYAYDSLGNRASLTFGNGVAQTYAYDPVSRLQTLATNVSSSPLTIGAMTYNPAGQITSTPRSNNAYSFTGLVDVSRNYATNGLNQYTTAGAATFAYDANGNLTSDGTNSFVYDVLNRMTSATVGGVTSSLHYDPLDRLWQVSGGTTSDFLYDDDHMVAHYDGTGALQHRYVFGPGTDEPIVEYDASGNRTFLSADERGSIIARTDASGALLATNSYDEYGIPGPGNGGVFQYTGQMWIAELGMYNYKNRVYSPTLGRFMQPDPIGYEGDGPNLYAYVLNDPVNEIDPTGLDCANGCAPIDVIGQRLGEVSTGGLLISGMSFISLLLDSRDDFLCAAGDTNSCAITVKAKRKTQSPNTCQSAFLKSQLYGRGLPTSQIDNLKFVSGLNSNANFWTRRAFNGGAIAVTQGSTVYVQPTNFNLVANFRSPVPFEEAYHTAQFASDSGFYSTYAILSTGGLLSVGNSYKGNAYEAFAQGASHQMFSAYQASSCSR